ncbi:MAG: helix-turn-helix domain-containing protein [Anaerolineaceae bacterium]|nr:helix-turn-helix domain-containing protein [Anaerolineaceae bacterium]
MHSFGFLLREYRNRSIDPETGKRLSQEKLAARVGTILGTTYTAQAVSDWERGKSQIHKDHRQVLSALIQTLHTCGGLDSLEEAERLLAAGNYRGLSHTEAESIFLVKESDKHQAAQSSWNTKISTPAFLGKKELTPFLFAKLISSLLCWIVAWLAICPILDFSNEDPKLILQNGIMLIISGMAIPIILAWMNKLGSRCRKSLPTRFLNFIGGVLGFALGLANILTLALLCYNLYIYPWPAVITLILSSWPIGLGIIGAKLTEAQVHAQTSEIHFKDIKYRWFFLLIPTLISLGYIQFHGLISSQLFAPLTFLLLSFSLGWLFWSKTRKIS